MPLTISNTCHLFFKLVRTRKGIYQHHPGGLNHQYSEEAHPESTPDVTRGHEYNNGIYVNLLHQRLNTRTSAHTKRYRGIKPSSENEIREVCFYVIRHGNVLGALPLRKEKKC